MYPSSLKDWKTTPTLHALVDEIEIAKQMVTVRQAVLQQKSGEFSCVGIVGYIRSAIDISKDYETLVKSLVPLRNTLYFTGFAMQRLTEISRSKGNEKPEVIASVLAGMYNEFVRVHPEFSADVDRAMAGELVLSPFNGMDDFHLASPMHKAGSYVEAFSRLYNEVVASGNATIGSPGLEMGTGEAPVIAPVLARLRVLDWLFQLFDAPIVWSTFLPADKSGEAAQMGIRRAGLQQIAGFFHALLSAELVFGMCLLRATRKTIEAWVGTIPTTYAVGVDPFERYVTPYDVLDFNADAVAMAQALVNQRAAAGPVINGLLTGAALLPSWGSLDTIAANVSRQARGLYKLSSVRTLLSPAYTPLMVSSSLAELKSFGRLEHYLKLGEDYHTMSLLMGASIGYTGSVFLTKRVTQDFKALGLKCPMPWALKFDLLADASASVQSEVKESGISIPISKPQANGATLRMCAQRHLMTFSTSKTVVDAYQDEMGINHPVAARLRQRLGLEGWKTLVPANYAAANANVHSTDGLQRSDSLLSLLAQLSGRVPAIMARDLQHWRFRAALATAHSGWLQLIDLTLPTASSGGGSISSKTKGAKAKKRSDDGTMTFDPNRHSVIQPMGMPFGLDLRRWSSMFGDAPVVVLLEGLLGARIIKNTASPTPTLVGYTIDHELFVRCFQGKVALGEIENDWDLARATQGTAATKDVYGPSLDRWGRTLPDDPGGKSAKAGYVQLLCEAQPMVHYAAYPAPRAVTPQVGFDSRYAYVLDGIVGSLSVTESVTVAPGDAAAFSLKTLDWQGSSDSGFSDFIGFGAEINMPQVVASPVQKETATKHEIMKRVAQQAKAAKEAQQAIVADSPTKAQADAGGKVISQTKAES